MKHPLILLLFVPFLILSSCKKIENILPDQAGAWEVISWKETIFERTTQISESEIRNGIFLTFYDDGLLLWDEDGWTSELYWEASEKNDLISICNQEPAGLFCFTYDVERSARNRQIWEGFEQDGVEIKRIRMELERIQ